MANDDQTPAVPPVLTVVPAVVPEASQPVPAPVAATPPTVQEVIARPVQAAVQQATAPVLSFSEKLGSGVLYLWKNDKVFLLVFGILIFLGYATSTLMDMITNKSNSDVVKTKDEDAQLATKENAAKAQATNYQQQADEAEATEPKVDEDWNVKK